MKAKLTIVIAIVALAIVIVLANAARKEKSDQLQNPYTGVATVNAVAAKNRPFPRLIEETGVLTGVRESIVSAEIGGQVVEVFVEVGGRVAPGAPLIRLDDDLLRLEAARARNVYEKAKMDYDRVQSLHSRKGASDAELEGMRLGMEGAEVGWKMAQKNADEATIRAPFGGVVAQRFTELGQMIERSMPVVQLIDNSQLKLTLQIREDQIRFIDPGSPAIVHVDAAADSVVGQVVAVGAKASMGARTFPVELRMPGSPILRSGMFARASIDAGFITDAIVIPGLCVLPDAGKTIAYISRDNIAYKVDVTVIGVNGAEMAVSGVSEGDVVVTTGNLLLSQGMPLSVKMESGNAQ